MADRRVRLTPDPRWLECAELAGLSVEDWIRATLDAQARVILRPRPRVEALGAKEFKGPDPKVKPRRQ